MTHHVYIANSDVHFAKEEHVRCPFVPLSLVPCPFVPLSLVPGTGCEWGIAGSGQHGTQSGRSIVVGRERR